MKFMKKKTNVSLGQLNLKKLLMPILLLSVLALAAVYASNPAAFADLGSFAKGPKKPNNSCNTALDCKDKKKPFCNYKGNIGTCEAKSNVTTEEKRLNTSPVYIWNKSYTVLLDVRYRTGTGYRFKDIQDAYRAFSSACGKPGQTPCWGSKHVGIVKNATSNPPVVAGFYQAPDGWFYLVNTGQCVLTEGCIK